MPLEIRVRAKTNRFGFDGDTGCLVLAGVLGTVSEMMLQKTRQQSSKPEPRLRVFWDACLLQDKANKEPDVTTTWEEDDVDPASVEYVETRELPDPYAQQPTPTPNTGTCGNCGQEVNFNEHDRDACGKAAEGGA